MWRAASGPRAQPWGHGCGLRTQLGMLHWALPRRAWVNQDSAHVLTGPRPPQALPRPGRPGAPSRVVPDTPAEACDVAIAGKIATSCFSPFGQLGNRRTESSRGRSEVAQQDRGRASSNPPGTPPAPPGSDAAEAPGPRLFSSLSKLRQFGAGPLAIQAPRDRRAQLNRPPVKMQKGKQDSNGGINRDIPRRKEAKEGP